tara:strand:- start:141 stop:269 length:129 start_codon:yes stop_codon:yes gene_type:complete
MDSAEVVKKIGIPCVECLDVEMAQMEKTFERVEDEVRGGEKS